MEEGVKITCCHEVAEEGYWRKGHHHIPPSYPVPPVQSLSPWFRAKKPQEGQWENDKPNGKEGKSLISYGLSEKVTGMQAIRMIPLEMGLNSIHYSHASLPHLHTKSLFKCHLQEAYPDYPI